MKKYVITLYQNTALPVSARIGTCYCFPIPTDSRKLFLEMYLKLGLTVVVMRHSREDSQLRMLRRMLIVLSLYPAFILRCQKWCDLNPSIPLDLLSQLSFLERYELPKLTKLPLSVLMESALNAMVIFAQLNLLGRISFDYSPDFRTLFVNLHRVFTSYFLLRSQRPNESFVADVLIWVVILLTLTLCLNRAYCLFANSI